MISASRSSSASAVAARATAGGNAPAVASTRDTALDFAKGGLVLCMIGYHTLNYFRYDVNLLRHLHFLPPSFIFIAGFLITAVYLPRCRSGDDRVYRRLFLRGLKTLALFVALNLAVHAVFSTSYNRALGLDVFVANLDLVFLTGEQRASVFGVLLPISYLLLLSAALLRLNQAVPYSLQGFAGGTFLLCAGLAQRGLLVFNLDLLSMGLLGMVAGLVSKTALAAATRHLAVIVALYLIYSVAIRTWYPTYLINTVGVALSLVLLYALGRQVAAHGFLGRAVTLLGNYSLLSYLVQIAFLQLLFRVSRAFGVMQNEVLLPLALTIGLTFAAIKVTDLARGCSPLANRGYQAVFA